MNSPHDLKDLELTSESRARTEIMGGRVARFLDGSEIICLQGELGTGKTVFTQGIARGLGIEGPVISPTYMLVREYRAPAGRPSLNHIDFYRLDSPREALTLGLEDYFASDGVCVIEWADKAEELLPKRRLWIRFEHLGENKRRLRLSAAGERYEKLLARLRSETAEGKS